MTRLGPGELPLVLLGVAPALVGVLVGGRELKVSLVPLLRWLCSPRSSLGKPGFFLAEEAGAGLLLVLLISGTGGRGEAETAAADSRGEVLLSVSDGLVVGSS